MPVIHFLNVKRGDCSIIQHFSGHVTVIDVCNAKPDTLQAQLEESMQRAFRKAKTAGNFNQKDHPVNPILYMKNHDIGKIFRFILTHPDMDHLDGVAALWDAFNPANFWDTNNTCEKDDEFKKGSPYNYDDWAFYKKLRAGRGPAGLTRLALFSGAKGQYWNRGAEGKSGGDGITILAPTSALVSDANECNDFNDCSYVLLYQTCGFKILFGGDSHDKTWDHILQEHEKLVTDIDLLIAPHHGRKSGRDYSFLDVLRPKMTFFGNAASEHLAYSAWNYRELPFITNNQAGSMVVEATDTSLDLYVTNEEFARAKNPYTFESDELQAWYVQEIARTLKAATTTV